MMMALFQLLDTLCGDKKLNARSEYLVSKINDIKLKITLTFPSSHRHCCHCGKKLKKTTEHLVSKKDKKKTLPLVQVV